MGSTLSYLLILLLFVSFQHQNGLSSFSTHRECQLEYRIEHGNGQIEIRPQWTTQSCREEGAIVPDLDIVGIQPLVRLSTCSRKAEISGVGSTSPSLSIGHTLLTLARENHSSCVNTTIGCSLSWMVDVPAYFNGSPCVAVLVEGSDLGSGVRITTTRTQLWTTGEMITIADTNISQMIAAENGVEVIDAVAYAGASVALVRNPTNHLFQLYHSVSSVNSLDDDHQGKWVINTLPRCVDYQEGQALWKINIVVGNEICEGENDYQFLPTGVAAVSRTEVYVFGNGLLFSPNRGVSLYTLQAPGVILETKSFTASSKGDVYALIWTRANQTNSTASNEVWLGFIGKADLFLLYPSTLCDEYWQSLGLELEDPTLGNTTLEFDDNNNLFLATGNSSVKLPQSLLIKNYKYNAQLPAGRDNISCITPPAPSTTNQYHHLYQIGLQYYPLAMCPTTNCPFIDRIVQAPVCERITRTKFHVREEGVLSRIDKTALAELNCSVNGSSLPGDIFLDKSGQYNFTMEFFLGREVSDFDAVTLAMKLSTPDVLSIQVMKSYQSVTNSLIFEVFLEELQHHSMQLESGVISTSVDISLYAMGAIAQCLDPSSTSVQLPGYVDTRVHIGCPPGLSIIFDATATSSHFNQYCTPTSANISCFYSGNTFYPTFLLVDSVTEERNVFTGQYTLRAIAGGSSEDNMRPFSLTDIVEAGIWTPVNESKDDPVPTYNYSDNGLTWVCSTTSPCGEKIPGAGRSPEYYLLLEASNRENGTYCALSVQFTIKLHGLSMGGITTVISLIMFLVMCSLGVLLMFTAWHYRLKFMYCADIVVDRWNNCWPDNRERLVELIRKHRGKINPSL